jgi:hypothetical protein
MIHFPPVLVQPGKSEYTASIWMSLPHSEVEKARDTPFSLQRKVKFKVLLKVSPLSYHETVELHFSVCKNPLNFNFALVWPWILLEIYSVVPLSDISPSSSSGILTKAQRPHNMG